MKAKLFHFRGVNSNELVYGYCVEDFEENIEKINLKLSEVLLINTNRVEYNSAIGGAFKYKLKSFKKRLDR